MAGIFPQNDGEAKEQPGGYGKTRTDASPLIARAFPADLELAITRGELTVKAIEGTTRANRNTIKVHVKKLAGQQYLVQVGKGRGARYMMK